MCDENDFMDYLIRFVFRCFLHCRFFKLSALSNKGHRRPNINFFIAENSAAAYKLFFNCDKQADYR